MSNILFATHSGKLIDFTNIRSEDICLEDISHHLTKIQRFGGSLPLNIQYSVASHSLNCFQVAKWLYPNDLSLKKAILMHDATEAYLGDVVSGLKTCLFEYQELEKGFDELISKRYNIWKSEDIINKINEIDKRMMLTEAYYLSGKFHLYKANSKYEPYCLVKENTPPKEWCIKPDKYPELIKQLFLDTCKEVGIHD